MCVCLCVCVERGVTFSLPLLQLVDLFLSEKWSDYISEYPQLSERYHHVPPRMVHSLLHR